MFWLRLISFLVFRMSTADDAIVDIEIGSPGAVGTGNNLDLAYIGPAFEAAVNDCNRLYSKRLNFVLTALTVDSREYNSVSSSISSFTAVGDRMFVLLPEWYHTTRRKTDSIAVVITGGGQETSIVHQLSAEWNTLYLTTVAYRMSTYTLSGPPPLVTAVISVETLSITVVNLLERYNWTTVFRVVDQDSPVVYQSISTDMDVSLKKRNSRIVQYKRIVHSKGVNPFPDLLHEFRDISRVLLFLGRAEPLRRLMLAAAAENLINGEFVYICVEPYRYVKQYGNYTWQYGDLNDQIALEAFRSLLTVHPVEQEAIQTLTQLRRAAAFGAFVRAWAKDQYNISYNFTDLPLWDALSTYSTIKMYCQVVNETLHTEGLHVIRDGRRLAKKFLNLTFQDEYSDIFIDRNGIRRTTLAVSYFSGDSQGNREAFLIQAPHKLRLDDLDGNSLEGIWPGMARWPPPNEPFCGYRNDSLRCHVTIAITSQPIFIAAVTAVLVTTASLGVLVSWYHYKIHLSRLYDPWWRLYPEFLS